MIFVKTTTTNGSPDDTNNGTVNNNNNADNDDNGDAFLSLPIGNEKQKKSTYSADKEEREKKEKAEIERMKEEKHQKDILQLQQGLLNQPAPTKKKANFDGDGYDEPEEIEPDFP